MNLREILEKTVLELSLISDNFAKIEAEEIICLICKCSKSDIYLKKNTQISQNQILQIQDIILKRKSGKPLAYCAESKYFYDREFFVNENVLIPRQDTEILIQTILDAETDEKKFILELGAGSGIISQILRSKCPNWQIVSVDISFAAVQVAKKNCDFEILVINCDKFSAINGKKNFDFIVSNPPYIESSQIENLDASVKDYEPKTAIDGGENGLVFYEYLAEKAKNYLKEKGKIYCEIGYNQGNSTTELFKKNNFENIKIIKDFGGHPRVICAEILC
jgi:release factor glutamine methyltransferase